MADRDRRLSRQTGARNDQLLRQLADGRMFRVSLDLDQPVNVSAFDSFDVMRRRLSATLNRKGETVEKITGGTPQLKLDV